LQNLYFIMAKATMVFFGIVLMLAYEAVNASREWYCKLEDNKYQICHKNPNGIPEPPNECKCENMKFAKSDGSFELYGGPEECENEDDAFCFVTEGSSCFDIEYSSVNERIEPIWSGGKEIYYSYEACYANQDDRIGNEEVLQGVRIIDDRIKVVNDNNEVTDEDISFYYEEWEECQDECLGRQGNCGAWSFDDEKGICYLHTVESCCGQFGKRKKDSNWISGYACHKCWSTKRGTDCPCPRKERQQAPNTAHGAGGRAPLHATSSGSLTVQSVNVARNACKCVPKRTRRGRIRCKKPFCAKPGDKEGCQDKRKCRLKKKRRRGRSLLDYLDL